MFDPKNLNAMSKAELDGQIVSGTLDALNSPTYSSGGKKKCKATKDSMSSMYDFNKSVLSAAYEAKGAIIRSDG